MAIFKDRSRDRKALAVSWRFKVARMRFIHSVLTILMLLASCTYLKPMPENRRGSQAPSTFAKFLESARGGDPRSQNLIGFMLYFGEAAPQDRFAAHRWFHLAAEQGDASAQLNVAVMHYLGTGVPKDLAEAERYFRLARANGNKMSDSLSELVVPDSLGELAERAAMRPENHDSPGESTYATFCAGCHGLNGIAAYVGAPSFALAERMEKSDTELIGTIIHGHGVMPNWKDKISRQGLIDALRFVRTLPRQYQNGIAQVLRTAPSLYFLFGPMSADPIAYEQNYLY